MAREFPLTWQSVLAASLVLSAGTLHFVYAPVHISASRGQGFFFLALGFAQTGWGAYTLQNPTPRAYLVGLPLMAVVPAALYGATRITPAPFGSHTEGIDILGAATFFAQVAAAVLLGWHGIRKGIQWQRPNLGPAGLALLLVVVGLLAAVAALVIGAGFEALVPWLTEGEATGDGSGGHSH